MSPIYGPKGETIRRTTRKAVRSTDIRRALMAQTTRPRKVGDGPALFTATGVVDRQPFRWDTNGFYRRLGVATDCTRVEVARAFMETDPRSTSLDLAVALQVLISREMRTVYDAVPLGAFYRDDPALIDVSIEAAEDLDESAPPTWAIYADHDVTDAEAQAQPVGWRSALAIEVGRIFPPGLVMGVGVSRSTWRCEPVGQHPVCFVPLDAEATPDYVGRAVDELIKLASASMSSTTASTA